MNCVICHQPIEDYNSDFNQLKIDETLTVDFCPNCIDKFIKWRQNIFVTLYPTTQAKKWAKK